jgi:hypothetical protein
MQRKCDTRDKPVRQKLIANVRAAGYEIGMKFGKSLLRPWLWGGLMLLSAGVCLAEEFEIIQYTPPAGWKAAERPGQAGLVLTSPDSTATQQALILVLLTPPQEGLDLTASFEAAVKGVISNGKLVESTDAVTTKTRQGFDAVSRTLVIQNAGEERVFARMIAAKVENRMAGIYYLTTTQELYDLHQADMAAMLQSVRFSATGTPLAANGEIEALEAQKQDLLKKVAAIEAKQRQLGAVATAGAPAAAGAAAESPDQVLARAKAQYAKEAGTRRKPHTVLGDILMLDGKPIPNAAAYRVTVWGTTIAGEKTQYGLEVDQNGHYEQQVPDGLYKIEGKCIVTYGGVRVPVDLVWLDDKKVGVVQASDVGIVRDFRLVMNGLKPGEDPKGDNSYFGGVVDIHGPDYDLHAGNLITRYPGSKVQFTFTALGPLIDGSRLDPMTLDMDGAYASSHGTFRSIPLGAYRVSATLIDKNGGKKLLQCKPSYGNEYSDSVDILWQSFKDDPERRGNPSIYIKD